MGFFQLISMLPGAAGDYGARRLMALVWRNYFDPPSSAPSPDEAWLDGIRTKPMLETRKAIKAEASQLQQMETQLNPGTQVSYRTVQILRSPTTTRRFARRPFGRLRARHGSPSLAKSDRCGEGAPSSWATRATEREA